MNSLRDLWDNSEENIFIIRVAKGEEREWD